MSFSFDLTCESLLPCVLPDSNTAEFGLRDALVRAHEIAELRGGSPLVAAALQAAAWGAAASWLSATPEARPDTERIRQVVTSFAPERAYWSRLERLFRRLLGGLADDGVDLTARTHAWYWDGLDAIACWAFGASFGRLNHGRDLKALEAGRRALFVKLKQIRDSCHIPERGKGAEKFPMSRVLSGWRGCRERTQ